MKKIFLLIILILIFGIINVKADSCYNQYSPLLGDNFTNLTGTVNLGVNRLYTSLPNNQVITLPNNQTYFKGSMFYAIARTNDIISSNINWTETCNRYTSADIGGYTITYADGTHATISPDSYGTLCDRWTSSGSMSYTQNYEPNITTIGLQYYTSNNAKLISCEVDSNGNFTCPIDSTYNTLSGFRFIFTMEKYNSVSIKYGLLSGNFNYCTSDTQQIINNSNQNTQTIVNNITDDNITGNDSNTAINDIGDTFDTENDFLLGLLTIPYNFFNSLMNIFEDNCTSLNLGTMFDKPLVFPCISLTNLLGNVFTNVIDVIFCGLIMSAFLRRIVKYYQALLSLDERATQIGGVKIW